MDPVGYFVLDLLSLHHQISLTVITTARGTLNPGMCRECIAPTTSRHNN